MTCQKKNKRSLVYCLLLQLCLVVVIPLLFSANSYASETTLQSVDDYFKEHNFYETCAYVCRKYASFPYTDYLTGANSGIAYDAFAQYLEDHGKSELLDEDVIITGSGGGRGYDIPQDVRQEMLNFVSEVYIQNNPLSYTECTITSYNFLDPTHFPSYACFNATKEYMKTHDGYHIVFGTQRQAVSNPTFNSIFIVTIPRSGYDLGFVGTTNNGSFTNVHLYMNWLEFNGNNYFSSMTKVAINGSGTVSSSNAGYTNNSLMNGNVYATAIPSDNRGLPIFTSYEKNELVYVFSTLNAYKAYNSGNPASYYIPSNSQSIVPYYDGFTQSDLNSAGNFYNNIVINTSGDSPTEIKKKTDSILGSLDSLFGSDESTDNGGGLLGGLADIITGATGAISPIKEIVLGDIKALIEDTFSWLPPTIITIWIAGITFGVFFGVLKLIRG